MFADGTTWSEDELTRNAFQQLLTGSDDADLLSGSRGNDYIEGGLGDDTLSGKDGSDVYVFSRGDGTDSIEDDGFGDTDRLVIHGYVPADVTVSRSAIDSDDLVIAFADTSDRITIWNTLDGSSSDTIERIEFDDGTVWTPEDLRNRIVSDMKATGAVVGTRQAETYRPRPRRRLLLHHRPGLRQQRRPSGLLRRESRPGHPLAQRRQSRADPVQRRDHQPRRATRPTAQLHRTGRVRRRYRVGARGHASPHGLGHEGHRHRRRHQVRRDLPPRPRRRLLLHHRPGLRQQRRPSGLLQRESRPGHPLAQRRRPRADPVQRRDHHPRRATRPTAQLHRTGRVRRRYRVGARGHASPHGLGHEGHRHRRRHQVRRDLPPRSRRRLLLHHRRGTTAATSTVWSSPT